MDGFQGYLCWFLLLLIQNSGEQNIRGVFGSLATQFPNTPDQYFLKIHHSLASTSLPKRKLRIHDYSLPGLKVLQEMKSNGRKMLTLFFFLNNMLGWKM